MRFGSWWGAAALGVAGCAAGGADSGTSFNPVTISDGSSQGDPDTSGSSTGFLTTSVSAEAGENDSASESASESEAEADTSATDSSDTNSTTSDSTTSPVSDGSESTTSGDTTDPSAEDDNSDTNSTTSTTGGQQGGQPNSGMYSHCTLNNNTCNGAANICIHTDTDGFCSDDGCVNPNADCDPVPVDSNAPPMCVEAVDGNMNQVFFCAIDCSGGQTCPAGMVCVYNLSFGQGLPVYDMCM